MVSEIIVQWKDCCAIDENYKDGIVSSSGHLQVYKFDSNGSYGCRWNLIFIEKYLLTIQGDKPVYHPMEGLLLLVQSLMIVMGVIMVICKYTNLIQMIHGYNWDVILMEKHLLTILDGQ